MVENIENSELELEENSDSLAEIEDGEVVEEQPIPEIDSKYRMILLAAQRSKQLQRNATPRVGMDPKKSKPTRIAMEELRQKKINFKILTPEGEEEPVSE